MRIVWLMNSPGGRLSRGLPGAALLAAGVLLGGAGGLVLALIGRSRWRLGSRDMRGRTAAADPAPGTVTGHD